MVYLPGPPSHIDMDDGKPNAPAEFRGEFRPIRTNVPDAAATTLRDHSGRSQYLLDHPERITALG